MFAKTLSVDNRGRVALLLCLSFFILLAQAVSVLGATESVYGPAVFTIAGIDTEPPNIDFVFPTPDNNSNINITNNIIINITSNESLSTCLLEWNGTNESMTVLGTSCFKAKTELSNGNYTYKVFANDTAGNFNSTDTRYITIAYIPSEALGGGEQPPYSPPPSPPDVLEFNITPGFIEHEFHSPAQYIDEIYVTDANKDDFVIVEFICTNDQSCDWVYFMTDGLGLKKPYRPYLVYTTNSTEVQFLVDIPYYAPKKEHSFRIRVSDKHNQTIKEMDYLLKITGVPSLLEGMVIGFDSYCNDILWERGLITISGCSIFWLVLIAMVIAFFVFYYKFVTVPNRRRAEKGSRYYS